jgi:hypothetical protein
MSAPFVIFPAVKSEKIRSTRATAPPSSQQSRRGWAHPHSHIPVRTYMSHSLLTFVVLSALLLGAHSFNPTTTKSYTRGPSTLAHPHVVGYLPRGTRARFTARPVSMMAFWDFLTNKGNEPAAPGSPSEGGISTLPRSYDEIHRQATDCIRSALAQGYRAVEVSTPSVVLRFPERPQLHTATAD